MWIKGTETFDFIVYTKKIEKTLIKNHVNCFLSLQSMMVFLYAPFLQYESFLFFFLNAILTTTLIFTIQSTPYTDKFDWLISLLLVNWVVIFVKWISNHWWMEWDWDSVFFFCQKKLIWRENYYITVEREFLVLSSVTENVCLSNKYLKCQAWSMF